GVSYFYNVTALNPSGTESSFSNSVSVTIPILPAVLLSQGFETCSSFSAHIPGWQILSQNVSPAWAWNEISYPHEGEALGWITFAPAETSPPLLGHAPYNGSKMLLAMSSLSPPNNAWLISPAINLGTDGSLSFFARSAYADYGLERLRVLISVTDAAPASFSAISLGEYLTVPIGWTMYNYDISHYGNQRVYLAWQCVSVDAFALFMDAIQVRSVGGSVAVEDAYLPATCFRNFPNPAKGHFKLESGAKAPFSFELFDLKGRKLYASKDIDAFDSSTLGTELAAGVYLIRISAQGKSQVLKQVILK
ncbi:MAG: choice-of-anchor J domain-containing protein, partial [Candidatus Cloacimonas sp.]|nr:choice-of-anchor J domain-containing protein [Candidatus Cloacimonas sp.]